MWDSVLPTGHLKQAIRQFVEPAPVSFVALLRVLPQLKGTDDLTVNTSFILWRGLSAEGVGALQDLHADSAIFFWLCSPDVYARTGDAPFLRLASRSPKLGECPWLPTLIHGRAPTAAESRVAVKEYVADLARYALPPR
jgi:hypothetical protein